jgi:hypothetical protein
VSAESGAVAIEAASMRSSGGFDTDAVISFFVASNESSRSCKLEGRWYTDSSSSSSACDSPFVNGGVAACDSSSSTRSGAGVLLLALVASSVEVARDRFSFSGAGVAGKLGVGAGDLDACADCANSLDNCANFGCVVAGELVALARAPNGARPDCAADPPGGGGRGAMPTPFLSLAAAAAAAEAYFNGSPGIRVGIGAGFMVVVVELEAPGNGVCNVANAGNGDFICIDDLRAPDCVGSTTFGFGAGGFPSKSGVSS